MIRKGLKLFRQFLSIGLSDYTLYLNYTLALLKSKIPTDLNQTVTLLSLSPEELPRKVEFKNVHKYISLEIFTGKWFLEKCQDLFSRPVLQSLERKRCNYFWGLGFLCLHCTTTTALRDLFSQPKTWLIQTSKYIKTIPPTQMQNRNRSVYKLVH